jgi:hypothetical protein
MPDQPPTHPPNQPTRNRSVDQATNQPTNQLTNETSSKWLNKYQPTNQPKNQAIKLRSYQGKPLPPSPATWFPPPRPPWADEVRLSLSMQALSLSMPEQLLSLSMLILARNLKLRRTSPFKLIGKTEIPKFQHVVFCQVV